MEEPIKSSTPASSSCFPQDSVQELLSPEIVREVKKNLRREWLLSSRVQYQEELGFIWSPPNPVHPEYNMLSFDCTPQGDGRTGIPSINPMREHLFFNKATAFYWTHSAYDDFPPRHALRILGTIWNTWFDALGREPQVQLDEFFAVPVSVGKEDGKSITEIRRAHWCICTQVQQAIDKLRRKAKVNDWLDIRYSKLHPLCEALLTVFDKYHNIYPPKHTDGFRHYDDVGEKQTILLVRTGREDRLSAPISFDSLRHEALPLQRYEELGNIDVVRVPLLVGVRFVAKLLLREEAAFPESVLAAPHMSKDPDHPLMKREREILKWADERFATAQERGKISPSSTMEAVKKGVLFYPNARWEEPELNAFEFGWV